MLLRENTKSVRYAYKLPQNFHPSCPPVDDFVVSGVALSISHLASFPIEARLGY
jgi:hypothetical protein